MGRDRSRKAETGMAKIIGVKKCLIIGYGNTLRGDDGLGPYIVEHIQDAVAPYGATVRTMTLHQLDVTLASQIPEVDMVFFVDARADDSEELVRIEQIEPAAEPVGLHHTSHTISVPVLLRIALDSYGAAPLCFCLMPKGYDFSIGEIISPRARIAAACARNRIIEILRSHQFLLTVPRAASSSR